MIVRQTIFYYPADCLGFGDGRDAKFCLSTYIIYVQATNKGIRVGFRGWQLSGY
ncbi:MAG: hypothetical protein LBB84_06955 [Tannerellaceae bacterium]|jgi:hypothetical protein|nr:hypothetical protein [Tannerellaceae bacterium]